MRLTSAYQAKPHVVFGITADPRHGRDAKPEGNCTDCQATLSPSYADATATPRSIYEAGRMEWRIILLNFAYAALGVLMMFLSYRIFDWLTPQVNFPVELKQGNVAVAIFIAAIFVSIALIIGGALN